MVHRLCREMIIVIQAIATPSLERSTGCYRRDEVIYFFPLTLCAWFLKEIRVFFDSPTEDCGAFLSGKLTKAYIGSANLDGLLYNNDQSVSMEDNCFWRG